MPLLRALRDAPLWSKLFRTAMVLALIGALIAVYFVWSGISVSLEAERTLQANLKVIETIEPYVVSHQGSWPRSWDDLVNVETHRGYPAITPSNRDDISRRVSIDFDIDLNHVVDGSIDLRDVIRPVGVHYPLGDPGYDNLLKAIRSSRRGEVDSCIPFRHVDRAKSPSEI